MTFPFPSVKSLVRTMREAGNTSANINFAKLAAGQPWTTEADLREEFSRQEQAASLQPVTTAGVDE